MKVGAIIAARMGSSRLPGKTLIDICGKPALQRVIERVRAAKRLDDIIVATTVNEADNAIVEFCEQVGCNYYRGSEDDVLSRILEAAKKFKLDIVAEITADCPLIYWNHIDHLVKLHMDNYPNYDMTTNILTRTYPRGFDLRIVNTEALERSQKEVDNDIDRQHALTWIYLNPKGSKGYKVLGVEAEGAERRPDIELTLDTQSDYELLNWIFGFESQGYNLELNPTDIINLIDHYPHMYEKVAKVPRKDYFLELEEAYKNKPVKTKEQAKESKEEPEKKPKKRLKTKNWNK